MKKRTGRKRIMNRIKILGLWIVIISFLGGTGMIVKTVLNQRIEEKKFASVDIDKVPKKLLEAVEKNAELKKFVSEYPLKKDQHLPNDIQDDIRGSEIPMFLQWDERWGYESYGDGMMGLTGCGPTALSMVKTYLHHDGEWNPLKVAQFAEANGYYQAGVGTSRSLMQEGAQALGLTVYNISLEESVVRDYLNAGFVMIASVGPGDFTSVGHFIVIKGIDANGQFLLHDPNRMSNTKKTWRYEILAQQIVGLWAYQ